MLVLLCTDGMPHTLESNVKRILRYDYSSGFNDEKHGLLIVNAFVTLIRFLSMGGGSYRILRNKAEG